MINLFKKNYQLFLIVFFYLLFYFNFYQLEFYYDDYWFVSAFQATQSFEENFLILKNLYITRPIGLIYLSIISLIQSEKLSIYFLINIVLWLSSAIFLYVSFCKVFNKKFGIIFLSFIFFPSISSAFIFSPIVQGLSTISIFFWSISLYFISKDNNKKYTFLSILFYCFSVLSYEISFSLIPLNIFVYCFKNNILKHDYKKIFLEFIKIIFVLLIFVIVFYFFQKFAAGFSKANLSKYGFFEEDFLINLKKYFFHPIKILYYEVPKLWITAILKSINNFDINLLFNIFLFNLIIWFSIFSKDTDEKFISNQVLIVFNICIALVFLNIFLIYLIATSVPDLTGYYNRGLLSLQLLIGIFISQASLKNNKILFYITILILNLNFLSIYQKFLIHIDYGYERKKIIQSTYEKSINTKYIFTNFDTYKKKNNYNFIPIFSDEVYDYSNAIKFYYKKKISAHRIYKTENCKEILFIENGYLYGYVPSRNRKIKENQIIPFLNLNKIQYEKTDITIYDYQNNYYLTDKITNLNNLLKKIFKCK